MQSALHTIAAGHILFSYNFYFMFRILWCTIVNKILLFKTLLVKIAQIMF